MDNFEGARGDDDGCVTQTEFYDYYSDLSMSIPSDDYFVGMMESVWCISEDEQAAEYKEMVKHYVSQIRLRLLEQSNNSTEEFVIRKMFNDFDKNESGYITIDELTAMAAKLKLSIDRKFMYGIFKVIDVDNSGGIEMEEFINFLVNFEY